ncbi:flavin-containing amine oxidoreductase-domain containing protein [Chytriomyces sp. MP71]|nr:flavin-containing amine oxidoreductase-domain containing protein [Chytriomyces sp. MP71]
MVKASQASVAAPPPRESMAHFIDRDAEWNACSCAADPPARSVPDCTCHLRRFLAKEWEAIEAASLCALSIDEYNVNAFHGQNAIPRKGYAHLLHAFVDSFKQSHVQLNTAVTNVDTTGRLAYLSTTTGIYRASYVISTLPLGILKSPTHCPSFTPPLPMSMQHAIRALGFGLMNKAVFTFDKPFWPRDKAVFASPFDLSSDGLGVEMLFLFNLKMAVQSTEPHNVLVAYLTDKAAFWLETSDEEYVKDRLLKEFTRLFVLDAEPPVSSLVITRWSKEPFTLGSYSFLSTASTFADQDALAQPVSFGPCLEGLLVFAGEHTQRDHFATVHGALLSGERAARDVLGHRKSVGECRIAVAEEYQVDKSKGKEFAKSEAAVLLALILLVFWLDGELWRSVL